MKRSSKAERIDKKVPSWIRRKIVLSRLKGLNRIWALNEADNVLSAFSSETELFFYEKHNRCSRMDERIFARVLSGDADDLCSICRYCDSFDDIACTGEQEDDENLSKIQMLSRLFVPTWKF